MTLKSLTLAAIASTAAAMSELYQYDEYIYWLEAEYGNGDYNFTNEEVIHMVETRYPDIYEVSREWWASRPDDEIFIDNQDWIYMMLRKYAPYSEELTLDEVT